MPYHLPYTASDINHPQWYLKIISLRAEMKQIEDEISLCNDENNIQLLKEKIRKILLKIEILELPSEDDEDDEEQPEDDEYDEEQPEEQPENDI